MGGVLNLAKYVQQNVVTSCLLKKHSRYCKYGIHNKHYFPMQRQKPFLYIWSIITTGFVFLFTSFSGKQEDFEQCCLILRDDLKVLLTLEGTLLSWYDLLRRREWRFITVLAIVFSILSFCPLCLHTVPDFISAPGFFLCKSSQLGAFKGTQRLLFLIPQG